MKDTSVLAKWHKRIRPHGRLSNYVEGFQIMWNVSLLMLHVSEEPEYGHSVINVEFCIHNSYGLP